MCSVSPSHITSIVPLSNFPSFEFVSRYNSSLVFSWVYNAMAGIWPSVFWSVLLYCLHEFFHQLPNLNFYLCSYSIYLHQSPDSCLALFLKHKYSTLSEVKSYYWSNRCVCCVKVFTDLTATPPANPLVSTAPTMAHPGQIPVPWFSLCISAKNYSWHGDNHPPASLLIQTLPVLQVPVENLPPSWYVLRSPQLERMSTSSR